MRRFLLSLATITLIFCGPSLWGRLQAPLETVASVPPAKAAILFGAIVRNGGISPLHAERLQTGKALLEAGKVEKLVVSNAPEAARVMRDYLVAEGVSESQIELDQTAIRTPDSCIFEAENGGGRPVILVSQKFHLPRIALHCAAFDFPKSFVYADQADRAPLPLHRIAIIRTQRFLRECALSWSVILGLYPND